MAWTFVGCGQIGFEQLDPTDAGKTDAHGTDGATDGSTDVGDGSIDASNDASADAGTDAEPDANTDAGTDAGPDAGADGGADAGPDADIDAGGDCGAWSPFEPPSPLTELNTSDVEWAPHLSSDQLTIFFSRGPLPSSAFDLWTASRATRDDPFGPPTPISELNTLGSESSPTTSPDGREIFFARDEVVFRATRPGPAGAFSGVVATSLVGYGPSLAASGLTLYWTRGPDPEEIYGATRATTAAPFVSTGPLVELNGPTSDGWPSASVDEREIFFESERSGAERLYVATRSSAALPFGTPSLVSELDDGSSRTGDPDISVDGTTLVYALHSGGSWDLWVAVRRCL